MGEVKGLKGPSWGHAFGSSMHQLAGLAVVILGMSTLFISPASTHFVYGVFVSMPLMLLVTFLSTKYKGLFKPRLKSIVVGVISSLLLYLVFYLGNYAVKTFGYLVGLRASNETSIYSTISSHTLCLQIIILALDAFGFESYFRGVLQNFFAQRIRNSRTRIASAFLSALVDSLIHVISLNPLWVVTTFVADSVWGLTYFYTKDLSSNIASHLLWDILIFVIFPIT